MSADQPLPVDYVNGLFELLIYRVRDVVIAHVGRADIVKQTYVHSRSGD